MNTTAQESTACQSESRLTQQKLGLSNLNPMFQNKSIRRVSIVPCYYNKIKQNSNQLQLCILSSHIIGSYHLSWNALNHFHSSPFLSLVMCTLGIVPSELKKLCESLEIGYRCERQLLNNSSIPHDDDKRPGAK